MDGFIIMPKKPEYEQWRGNDEVAKQFKEVAIEKVEEFCKKRSIEFFRIVPQSCSYPPNFAIVLYERAYTVPTDRELIDLSCSVGSHIWLYPEKEPRTS